jgi:hypothetical protein
VVQALCECWLVSGGPGVGATCCSAAVSDELAGGGRVTDGGLLVEPEHGGQVKGSGPLVRGPPRVTEMASGPDVDD